jgi:capsular polysaccharide biosynthesis protein
LYKNTLSLVSSNKPVKPFRKVFISRKLTYSDSINIRIDDHEKLEKVFLDNGFDICYPESQFKTFSDQVTYFNETKVLCGISGGGLTNSIFMQPGGKILEMLTSFRFCYPSAQTTIEPKMTEELHEYYLHTAFQNKHTIVTLSNVDRVADEIEKELERTKVLDWLTKDD